MVALVDCNNFYASCEKVFDPGLAGKPLVILSNNDGCIISRSPEAKALGVEMAAPYFKLERELKRLGVTVRSSNYTLYGDMSERMIETIRSISPQVEVYSIDEAFADLSAVPHHQLWKTGDFLRKRILQWTGLPVKIGIGPTKTLAKVAAAYAKKQGEGKLFCVISKSEIEEVLKATPIGKVWGLGRGFQTTLFQYNIHTAWDFSQKEDSWIRQKMGVTGLRIAHELRGISCLPLEVMRDKRKHIMTSRSFGRPVTTLREMQEAILTYLSRCAEKLREDEQLTSVVSVYIRTYPKNAKDTQNNASQSILLPFPTDYNPELAKYALRALDKIFIAGYRYKKAGVLLSELTPRQSKQLPLFYSVDFEKSNRLMEVMDHLNHRWSDRKVKFSGEGLEQPWQMKSEKRSKRCTTHWDELVIVS